LEMDQIKSLIDTGKLPVNDGNTGDEGPAEAGEPIVDSIGDVRVTIQGKSDESAPIAPTGDIPNEEPVESSDGIDAEKRNDDEGKNNGGNNTPTA
jgi:cell division protease FtsH